MDIHSTRVEKKVRSVNRRKKKRNNKKNKAKIKKNAQSERKMKKQKFSPRSKFYSAQYDIKALENPKSVLPSLRSFSNAGFERLSTLRELNSSTQILSNM